MDKKQQGGLGRLMTLLKGSKTESALQEREVEGHRFGESVTINGYALVLNGVGVRRLNFNKIYTVGLYLPAPAKRVETVNALVGARRVELVLLRDVNCQDFVNSLREGIHDNTNETARGFILEELNQLEGVMKAIGDVKVGDVVIFDWLPAQGTFIALNGRAIGSPIRGKALYDAVLSIWLGPKAIDQDLKTQLLAGNA